MNNIFSKFPEIALKQVVLREIQPSDAKAFHDYMTHEHIKKYLADNDIPSSPEKAMNELKYWMNLFTYKNSVYWAIANKKNNKMIGTCGFNYWNKENKRLEISYDLNYSFWGKGIARRSVMAITDFAFKKMKVKRIQATVAIDNERSIRLLDACGYENEGKLAKYFNLHGIQKDGYMYAKIDN